MSRPDDKRLDDPFDGTETQPPEWWPETVRQVLANRPEIDKETLQRLRARHPELGPEELLNVDKQKDIPPDKAEDI